MTKNDGGPAFPRTEYYDEKPCGQTDGLSIRDWFAGQALLLLAGPETLAVVNRESRAEGITASSAVAAFAYDVADAMLRQRDK